MTFDRSPAARPAASSAIEELRPGIYRVYVRDFILPANIGVHDNERNGPQRVRINVDLHVVEGAAPLDDDIARVYSYEKVVDGVRDIIAGGHINLVETLAERIACLLERRSLVAEEGPAPEGPLLRDGRYLTDAGIAPGLVPLLRGPPCVEGRAPLRRAAAR